MPLWFLPLYKKQDRLRPGTIRMITKLFSKMYLFVLIPRFNNYLSNELDLGHNNKKAH